VSRLVAILGYSNGDGTLHEICAARLRRAETETRPEDVVLLSGWARRRASRSEAELMAEAWRGHAARVVVSGDARSTLGNARTAAEAARRFASAEVVLVTSTWHRRRAAVLFRAALRGTGARLVLASVDGVVSERERLRELLCWALVPAQAVLAARSGGNRRGRDGRDLLMTPATGDASNDESPDRLR
jgi:hypothetical protein